MLINSRVQFLFQFQKKILSDTFTSDTLHTIGFTQLKPKQEIELKVKNFIPPFSSDPEIFLLEVLPQDDPRMMSPLPMLLREDTPPHICHDLCHHSRARQSKPSILFPISRKYKLTSVSIKSVNNKSGLHGSI